jgi:heat-inducible transcriptional repressor
VELTERQERILKILVEDYVETGRPIGSATLLNHSSLNVSSATIRSELAGLEEAGLVLQLHTSGGRVPTTRGYRYFIEHLLPTPSLSGDDQITIRHQFHQAHGDRAEWLKLAAAVLAHRAHTVALVTSPRTDGPRLRRVELVEASPHSALIVAVLSDGTVLQETMSIESAVSQDQLRGIADDLNRHLAGASAVTQIEGQLAQVPEALRPFALVVGNLLNRSAQRRLEVYHEGLGDMLRRPEFSGVAQTAMADGERIRRVVDFLQSGLTMEDLLSLMAMESGVQVVIGGESPLQQLEDYAMVVGRYGASQEGSGVLGLLGPTRMDFGQAISLVRYMTELMTDLVFGR